MSEQEIKCPKCKSEFLLVERRLNGNAQCESCNWHGPYKDCFVKKEMEILESRIKELEAENKRFREALEREECSCSSSTGDLQTKGPDSICNRCQALSDPNTPHG